MKIGNYTIKAEKSSNFPTPVSKSGSIATRTRAQIYARNVPDVLVAADFLKKVAGVDRQYPGLVQVKKNVIKVQLSTAEIWAARCATIFGLYLAARGYF